MSQSPSPEKPTLEELVQSLQLPAEKVRQYDPIIDNILELLQQNKIADAQAALQEIDDDIVHDVGRRTSERMIGFMRSSLAVSMGACLGMAAGDASTGQEILQTHQTNQSLVTKLEDMFFAEYDRRQSAREKERKERYGHPSKK